METIRRLHVFLAGWENVLPQEGTMRGSSFSSLPPSTGDHALSSLWKVRGRNNGVVHVIQSTVSTIKSQVFEITGTKNLLELTTQASP